MKKYIHPTIKMSCFQDENVAVTGSIQQTYIAPVQNLIDNEAFQARLEKFSDLLQYN